MTRLGDRRQHPRFEVGSKLTATLDVLERIRVANIGPHGALLESAAPLPVGAEYGAHIVVADGHALSIRLRICRVSAIDGAAGPRYLVAVEFVPAAALDPSEGVAFGELDSPLV